MYRCDCRVLQAELADLRENPLHAAASMPNESPADVRHHVQASPSNRVSSTYLWRTQLFNPLITELQTFQVYAKEAQLLQLAGVDLQQGGTTACKHCAPSQHAILADRGLR